MTTYISSTDLLTQDPEAFDTYFAKTERESYQYQQPIENINSFWKDWPVQEAKHQAASHPLNKEDKKR